MIATLAVAGCGGGERQDKNEPNATYDIEIVEASFPTKQRLADPTEMQIEVRNAGNATIPNVAVTLEGDPKRGPANAFAERSQQADLADPSRPVWIVDEAPRGGVTAYVNTWALGELKAGQAKTFTWKVTAVRSGDFTVSYRVAAGLDGKAKARLASGGVPESSFSVNVSDVPPQSEVGPNGEVIKTPEA